MSHAAATSTSVSGTRRPVTGVGSGTGSFNIRSSSALAQKEAKPANLHVGKHGTRSPVPPVEPGQEPESFEPVTRKSRKTKKLKPKHSREKSLGDKDLDDDSASVSSDKSQDGKKSRKGRKKIRKPVEIGNVPTTSLV